MPRCAYYLDVFGALLFLMEEKMKPSTKGHVVAMGFMLYAGLYYVVGAISTTAVVILTAFHFAALIYAGIYLIVKEEALKK